MWDYDDEAEIGERKIIMGGMTKETADAYNNKWVKRDLEQLREQIKQLKAELEKHRWIPVMERLPENNGVYLGCFKNTAATESASNGIYVDAFYWSWIYKQKRLASLDRAHRQIFRGGSSLKIFIGLGEYKTEIMAALYENEQFAYWKPIILP